MIETSLEGLAARRLLIDPSALGNIQARLSENLDYDLTDPFSNDALQFYQDARSLDQSGDGVRCFVGLVMAVCGNKSQITLVDEPEAFLHPPLVRALARFLVEETKRNNGSLVVSTHSADFILGCLQHSENVSIIRLSWDGRRATAHEVAPQVLLDLARDPLFRHSSPLSGLFHRCAVIVESDGDRVIYDEVNQRLLAEGQDRGLEDLVFINAHCKSELHRLVKPLRLMGVPCAAIVDLDFLRDRRDSWKDLVDCFNINPEHSERDWLWEQVSEESKSDSNETKRKLKRRGILSICDREDRARAVSFISSLSEHGLFLVPVGELEDWLSYLNISVTRKDKGKWLREVLERLGTDSRKSNYVKAPLEDEDIWGFLGNIKVWINRDS